MQVLQSIKNHGVSAWPVLATAVSLWFLFILLVLPNQSAATGQYATAGTPDMSLAITPAEFHRMVAAFGPEGRRHYIQSRFRFDAVWPLVYAFFYLSLSTFLLRRAGLPGRGLHRIAVGLPLLALLADYGENLLAVRAVRDFPEESTRLVQILSLVTSLKWLAIILIHGLMATILMVWFVRRRRRRTTGW